MSGTFHRKKVLSRDTEQWLLCGYRDCENDGYECHKVQVNDSAPGYPPKIVNFVFCSERHRQYFIDAGQFHELDGMLRTGNKSLPGPAIR